MDPIPPPDRINNHHEDVNDIQPNDNAIERDNHMEIENNIIPNGDALRENNQLENEDDIEPNNVIGGDNHMEVENDIIPNHFNDGENQGGNVLNAIIGPEGEGQDVMSTLCFPIDSFSLEHIKNVLYVGLHQLFDEFEIKIARCPCLTRPPYNLAAVGLSGKPSIFLPGSIRNFIPNRINSTYDIRRLLLEHRNNFFVIGAGYAATESSMPANGHLTINAKISPLGNVINNSCIVYEEADTEERILRTLHDPNEMKCSMLGTFFLNDGEPGNVIEVRAKGRRVNGDIITLMQYCLGHYYYFRDKFIALGGVLMINGGRVMQLITPENYPEGFPTLLDFNRWLKCYELEGNLITVGALTNYPVNCLGLLRNEEPILHISSSIYKFHSFSNREAAGQFMNDVTPNETEYIGYFNVAQEVYVINE